MQKPLLQPDMGYQKSMRGSAVVFSVPASKSARRSSSIGLFAAYTLSIIGAPVFGGIITLVLAAIFDLRSDSGIHTFFLISAILLVAMVMFFRKTMGAGRRASVFSVTDDVVELERSSFSRGSMSDLEVFNALDERTTIVTGGPTALALAGALHDSALKGAYAIRFDYGDSTHVMADRMSFGTAEALAKDLIALGFSFR